MFEFIVLLDLASAHLIDRFVEILDQMKAIMDQRGVREQLCDARNVGLPHIGRNGLDLVLQTPQKSRSRAFTLFLSRPCPTSRTTPRSESLTTVAYLWPR